jgi:periplasmic copper chaperone A
MECMKRRHLLSVFLLPTVAFAHSYLFGAIAVGHAWVMESAGPNTNAMMPMVNNGSVLDSLISAQTEAAERVELRDADNVVASFVLEPHRPLPMRAAAKHLQLIGLRKPLIKGDNISLTLKFAMAGEAKIELHVSDKAGE